ncbi:MAG: branched-chain alpha-keto acid dehydrogenase subunit E2 [Planctomycetes bacterium]|nr:branched-chain alpha-keto acid dehydrogenase subunit E2 [Planctomycetota bacterium]
MSTEFKLPSLGENIESVRVVAVLVKAGDTVQPDQTVVELETDKAMMELPVSMGGVVEGVHVKAEQDVTIGQLILTLTESGTAPAEEPAQAESTPESDPAESEPPEAPAPQSQTPAAPAASVSGSDALAPAAPSVRRFAREIGIEINAVTGRGPHGRISVDDVKAYAKQLNTGQAPQSAGGVSTPALPPLPDFSKWGTVRRESMSPVRLKTARQMHLCWSQIPHVTQFDKADITELEVLRKRYAKRAEAIGGKLTMAVMVVKAVAQALKKFPKFNASIDMAEKEVIFKETINIGIAVKTERGLLVPVLHHVDQKNMIDISKEVIDIAGKARTGKVSMDDLTGGTFTITNLGSIGGSHFTPIVNYPEVAILGMGRAYVEAGFDAAGQCVPRTVLPLSLSYDHRLIDGAEGAAFLKWIVDAVEQPLILSLEG